MVDDEPFGKNLAFNTAEPCVHESLMHHAASISEYEMVEMRMLQLMYGHTRGDRNRNEEIRIKIRVPSVKDKMRKGV